MFTSLEEIVRKSKLENKPVSELMIEQEIPKNEKRQRVIDTTPDLWIRYHRDLFLRVK